LSPCHLVSTHGSKAYTWHISSVIFAPTQKLVNGSWYGSIVPLMIFFICTKGLGQVPGVASSCIFGILEKKQVDYTFFLMFI